MALTGFKRPSLDQIIRQIESDFDSNLPEVDSRLRFTVENALTKALAGGLHSIYGYLDWVADQTNVLYCVDENLDVYGVIWGITRKQSTRAAGTATVAGKDGTFIPSGTALKTTTGVAYTTTDNKTVAGGTVTLSLLADEYGANGNAVPGTLLSFVSPVAGISGRASVVAMDGGSDLESNTSYRERILKRINQAPHGGSRKDYVTWATEIPGVTRAWCYPLELGPGTVTVRFMMDDSYPNGIPQESDIAIVDAYIQERRPVTAKVTVLAPKQTTLNVTVKGLTPDNDATRAAATQELRDMIRREATPGGTLYYSWFWDAVSQATGARHHRISVPTTDVTATVGSIHVLGTVSFIE